MGQRYKESRSAAGVRQDGDELGGGLGSWGNILDCGQDSMWPSAEWGVGGSAGVTEQGEAKSGWEWPDLGSGQLRGHCSPWRTFPPKVDGKLQKGRQ